jgi:DNA-binding SARP family transcriptional activator
MLRVRVLGELAVEVDGRAVEPPTGRRARELLGWLALHPGTHPRSELASRFWPDVLDSSARASLRTALHDLRRALGESGAAQLETSRERAGLVGEVWVDAFAARELDAQGRTPEALELCRGELLTGLDEDWVLAARDDERRAVIAMHERLASGAEERGDLTDAVERTREQVRLDPRSEEATRRLMRRLAAAGDRSAALAACERLEERLRRELGVPPSAATRQLARELRAGEPSASGLHAGEPHAGAAVAEPRAGAAVAEPRAGGAAAPARQPPLPAALRRRDRSGFVGREDDLARLHALLDAATGGGRHAVLLAGEPGIGKTRLTAELCRHAHASGATVLFGRCYEDALAPYQPFVEALSDYARAGGALPPEPELARLVPGPAGEVAAAAGDPGGARYRLFEAVRGALSLASRGRGPAVLALDDLHWADRATLLLLAHLVRAGEPARLLVLGTYRESELSRAHPLAGVLADLRREPVVERVVLAGLAPAEVSGLVTSWIGPGAPAELTAALHEETGGNPFYLEEVLRNLAESGALGREGAVAELGIPESVKEVLGRRLSRLGDETGRVLAAAAVAGRDFELGVLERLPELAGLDVLSALEEATGAQLVREEAGLPGRFGFAHPLVRETLYEELSLTRRVRLHGAVAAALEDLHAGELEPHLSDLALHLLEAAAAGDRAHATEVALRAARSCLAQLAYDEAARICERALEADAGARIRCELRLALGDALVRAGRRPAGRQAFEEAAADARAAGDPHLLAAAALGHSGIGVSIIAVDEESVHLLEEALAALPEDGATRARLVARLAVETYYACTPAERKRLGDEAVAIARRSTVPEAEVAALNARRAALWSASYLTERLETDAEMIDVAERAGLVEGVLQGRNWLVADLLESGDLEGAREQIALHEQLAGELRLPSYQWWAPMWRSTLALLEGRYADAERLIGEFAEIGRRAHDPNAELYAEIQEWGLWWHLERFDDVLDHVLERELDRPADYAYRAGFVYIRAGQGRTEEARGLVSWLAADGFARLRDDMNLVASLAEIAQGLAVLGDAEHAHAVHDRLLPFADRNVVNARGAFGYGSASLPLGLLAGLAGLDDVAGVHLDHALERNRAMGARPWVARTQLARGHLLARRGDPGAAELFAAAAAEADAIGLSAVAEAARGARHAAV